MTNTRCVIILKNAVFKSLIVAIELGFLGHHAYRLSNVLFLTQLLLRQSGSCIETT